MPERRIPIVVLAVALALAASGCEKLPAPDNAAGPLDLQAVAPGGSIPAAYGRLVSVTSSAAYPGWAQLWFERDDRTVTTVFVNFQNGQVRDRILVLPRS